MEVSFQHALTFTTRGDVPVSVVAKNLLANERLLHESMRILGDCVDGIEIQRVTVKVSHVSNSSPLKEVFTLGLFLTFQKDLEREVPSMLEQAFGYQVPTGMETLITVMVMIVAIYVVDAGVSRLFPGKDIERLKADYQARLDELSRMTALPAATIEGYLKRRLSDGKLRSLLKKAYDFFRPAQLEANAEILVGDQVAVSREAINDIPTELDVAEKNGKNIYELANVEIDIHRSDIDYSQSGWIAVVDEVSAKRTKLVLPIDVKPSDLFGQKKIRGDILVVEELADDGEYSISEYHLTQLRRAGPSAD